MSKYLVINGDDFGINHAHNLGVVKAFTAGIMTTAGIMAPSPWAPEAIRLAREHNIPVGIHLTLSCEYEYYHFGPLTRAAALSRDAEGFVFHYKPGDIKTADLSIALTELREQIRYLQAQGVILTHLEEHMGCIPRWDGSFAEIVHTLAKETGLPFHARGAAAHCRAESIIPVTDYFSMPHSTFAEKKADFIQQVSTLQDGLYWVCSHVADTTDETQAAWGKDDDFAAIRVAELAVFCDPEVKAAIADNGIQLIGAQEAIALQLA